MKNLERLAEYRNSKDRVLDVGLEVKEYLGCNMEKVTSEDVEKVCGVCMEVAEYVEVHKNLEANVSVEEFVNKVCELDSVGKYCGDVMGMLTDMGEMCQGDVQLVCEAILRMEAREGSSEVMKKEIDLKEVLK